MPRAPLLIAAALLVLAGCRKADDSLPPHQIHIAGSSAAFHFSSDAAERLMREDARAIAPLVRAGGTGEGIARFCDGTGPLHPDIVIAARAMTDAETTRCAANGVAHIAAIPIGRTALVLVTRKDEPPLPLSRTDLTRAMTSTAVRSWAEVDARLPATSICIEGPAPAPGVADGLYEIIGAQARIRADGAYRGHGANARLIAGRVAVTPGAIGILPWPEAIAHADTLRILPLDGVTPTPDSIASGRYPASAPLILLAKPDEAPHVPSLSELLDDYADALAPDGAFVKHGLIPLPEAGRDRATQQLRTLAAQGKS